MKRRPAAAGRAIDARRKIIAGTMRRAEHILTELCNRVVSCSIYIFHRRYAEDITARLVTMESTKLILDVSHFTDSLELSEHELKAEFDARDTEMPDKLKGVMNELCKILDQCKELQGDLNNVELRYTIANECYRICRQSRGLFYEYLRTCSNPEQFLNEFQTDTAYSSEPGPIFKANGILPFDDDLL